MSQQYKQGIRKSWQISSFGLVVMIIGVIIACTNNDHNLWIYILAGIVINIAVAICLLASFLAIKAIDQRRVVLSWIKKEFKI